MFQMIYYNYRELPSIAIREFLVDRMKAVRTA